MFCSIRSSFIQCIWTKQENQGHNPILVLLWIPVLYIVVLMLSILAATHGYKLHNICYLTSWIIEKRSKNARITHVHWAHNLKLFFLLINYLYPVFLKLDSLSFILAGQRNEHDVFRLLRLKETCMESKRYVSACRGQRGCLHQPGFLTADLAPILDSVGLSRKLR